MGSDSIYQSIPFDPLDPSTYPAWLWVAGALGVFLLLRNIEE